jgi:FkbM family methyltransferase
MRVFVDVGAYYGEAVSIALDPDWGFDKIYAVEPAAICHPLLRQYRDHRVSIEPVALGKRSGTAVLFGAGLLGASIFESKHQKSELGKRSRQSIQVVRASDWFRSHISAGSEVFIKFNCEGAECDIIEDLLSAGYGNWLTSLYVDFDVRKVAGQAHRQHQIESQLQKQRIRYSTPRTFGLDGPAGVAKWLAADCSRQRSSWTSRWRYRLALHEPPYVMLKKLLLRILPLRMYSWLGQQFGNFARNSK